MTKLIFLLTFLLTTGCATFPPTEPSDPLSSQRQSTGYELSDGTVVQWGTVETGTGDREAGDRRGDWSDRSTAR